MAKALDCFVERYISYAKRLTDAPEDFHRMVGYILVSASLKNHVHIPYGDIKIFPNIWAVLIGQSSFTRKSTSVNLGKNIIREFDYELLLPAEFSHEKILEHLSKQSSGIFTWFEFAAILGLLSKDYMSGAKQTLADLYDGFTYERKTLNASYLIENPAISIMSATTLEWFLEKVKDGDMKGGFLARFLYVPATKKTHWIAIPPKVDQDEKQALIVTMKAFQSIKGEATIRPKAAKTYASWLKKFEQRGEAQDTVDAGFFSRMGIYALKFALLMEISTTRSLEITDTSMKRATKYMDLLALELNSVFEDNLAQTKFARNQNRLKKLIKTAPGISRTELFRKMQMPARELTELVDSLLEGAVITLEEHKNGSHQKKPTIQYYPNSPKY